ncbi:M50 family metallopeptidase [Neptunicoccus sediminis]|uniref:M50 family metallopeptidase n=1 Tax=Neptunicoccus sediminis TaxID=1892596 RepID=UPI000845CE08|nr:M50 family metallopeptidase [Neptunicoccus sediminis]
MTSRAAAFLRDHWQLLLLVALVFAFWRTPALLPLRLLTVFFHESAHAAATILTGGTVVEFVINANESGHVLSRGGSRFMTLSAGYLGSLLIGAALFLLAVRTRWDRWSLGALGAVIAGITLFYVRSLFALGFGLGTSAALLSVAYWLRPAISDFLLRLIGATSMIYVPYDIFADTIRGAAARSDARMLAEEFGGATVLWGALWLGISLWCIFLVFRYALRSPSNIALTK